MRSINTLIPISSCTSIECFRFSITGDSEKWEAFIAKEPNKFSLVKSYMHLKVKLLFDPPLGSAVIESINRQIREFEWRLVVAADPV